jgi:phosphate uptake regulator
LRRRGELWQGKQGEEARKVQFTGGSTYIISLPKRWIAENQIIKGSFIKLRKEDGGLLTIVPPNSIFQKKPDEATIRVHSNDDIETIKRKLVSSYLAGYNSIQIKADRQQFSNSQRYELKSFVRHMLVGTEIVSDASSQLILQVLLSYPELTVQSALRRMTIITTSMHNDAIRALGTSDKELVNSVVSTDNEVDRFNLYVTRLLKTAIYNPRIMKDIGLDNANDCLGYRILVKYLERTADHAVNIAENVALLKSVKQSDIVQKIEKMSTVAIMMFDTAMESLFRHDYNAAEKIIQNIKEVKSLEKDAILTALLNTEDGPVLRLIIESVKRTAEYACDIAEIVLDLTVDSILV